MAHTYFGSDELILTSANKQSFDSGLNRVDCVFKCRTTTADDYAILLTSGAIMPGFDDYIIKDPATKETGSDGFVTFTVSGFYGTLALSSGTATVPSVIGANVSDFSINISVYNTPDNTTTTFILNFKILSDTLTRTFTLPTTESITSLELPEVDLNYAISYASFSRDTGSPVAYKYDFSKSITENVASFSFYSIYTIEGISPYNPIDSDTTIINVSRSNFGNVDEVIVTWGQFFRVASEIQLTADYI